MWKKVLQIAGAIGTLLVLVIGGMQAQQTSEKIHSSPEIMKEAEEFFEEYDAKEVIANSVKEYMIDSIEEVNTQARWEEQQRINAMVLEILMRLDTNTRLNVRLASETKKLYEEEH